MRIYYILNIIYSHWITLWNIMKTNQLLKINMFGNEIDCTSIHIRV